MIKPKGNTLGKKGFTLIEILVALVILASIMVLLYSSFNAFLISSQRIKEAVLDQEKISVVSRRITQDMEAIFITQPPRYRVPEFDSDPDPYQMIGVQETMNQTTISSIIFTSLAHVDIKTDPRAGVARISYYLKPNDKNSFDLYRSDTLWPYPETAQSCHDFVLCTAVSGFEIIYIDTDGEEHTSWDSDSEDINFSYPKSIEFKLMTGSGDNLRSFAVIIDLLTGRSIDN